MATTYRQPAVRLTVDTTAAEQPAAAPRQRDEQPFVIVVLGDFRGMSASGPPEVSGPLAARRLFTIDRDNLDAVLRHFDVRWETLLYSLPGQSETALPTRAVFHTLEDFHPDHLVEQIAPLRTLCNTRQDLDNPSRFEAAATEVMRWAQLPEAASPPAAAPEPPPPSSLSASELLDHMVAQNDAQAASPARASWSGELRQFLQRAVGPYLVKIDPRRQEALLDVIDQVLSQQVRSILHDPVFRRLEAAWRGLHWLVHMAETGTQLKICLLQVRKDELQHDLAAHVPLAESALAHVLLRPGALPDGESVSLLLGNYDFAHRPEDLALLARLGSVAQQLSAPCVTAASPSLFGFTSFLDLASTHDLIQPFRTSAYREWQALRRSPEAQWLVLALPGFLLRLPYGVETEPIDSFIFEEDFPSHDHATLLWGNPAFAVGAAVAEAFADEGWALRLSSRSYRLQGLPLYVYDEDGMTTVKPCAEVLLPERVIGALREEGLVPLISHQHADLVTLPYLRSLAEPQTPLGSMGGEL